MVRRFWPIAVVLTLVWAVFGYYDTKPADFHDYRVAAVGAAQSAYDAVSTTELTVRAQLAGKTLDTFVHGALDEAVKATAGATKRFVGQAPVDAETSRMRDQLLPVLAAATRALGDLRRAEKSGDGRAVRRCVAALDPIGEQLATFIESHR